MSEVFGNWIRSRLAIMSLFQSLPTTLIFENLCPSKTALFGPLFANLVKRPSSETIRSSFPSSTSWKWPSLGFFNKPPCFYSASRNISIPFFRRALKVKLLKSWSPFASPHHPLNCTGDLCFNKVLRIYAFFHFAQSLFDIFWDLHDISWNLSFLQGISWNLSFCCFCNLLPGS